MLSTLMALALTLGPPASVPIVGTDGGYPVAVNTVSTAAGPVSCELSDGASFYKTIVSTQLPAALDGSGFLKTHEQGTAAVHEQGTAAISATQLPAALDGSGFLKMHEQGLAGINVLQVGSNTILTGGLNGSFACGGLQANNTAIATWPLTGGLEARTSNGAPGTVATSGNVRYMVGDTYGDQWVREGSPNQFGLWIAALSTTLTQEVAAPAASTSIYVTDILCQSTTATASTCQLKWGTGANCGTGTVAGPIYTSPLNTASPTEVHAPHYILKVPAASALCLVCGSATNTCNISLGGYVAQ